MAQKPSRGGGLPDAGGGQPLVATDAHAENFRQARHSRRAELVEDYVELIADLIDSAGEARPVDVARRLGVTQATVSKMLRRLIEDGLVSQRPYRGVFLTGSGRALADASRARHRIVEAFLLSLGITAENARIDAEGIEHHVSGETLEAFRRHAGLGPGPSEQVAPERSVQANDDAGGTGRFPGA